MDMFGSQQTCTSVSVAAVFRVLASVDFSPEVRQDENGEEMILCTVAGHTTQVLFYGWSDGRARSMAFRVRFGDVIPLEVLNSLNERKRYVKYYAEENGKLTVEMDCSFGGGVSLEHVRYLAELWQAALETIS